MLFAALGLLIAPVVLVATGRQLIVRPRFLVLALGALLGRRRSPRP